MSLEAPDAGQRYAIARNQFRDYSRRDLLEWAVEERARDFEDWPEILHDHIAGLAEDHCVEWLDAAAIAIHAPDGIARMREWAREHEAAEDAASMSPSDLVGLIERRYPGGLARWPSAPVARPSDGGGGWRSRVRRPISRLRAALRPR